MMITPPGFIQGLGNRAQVANRTGLPQSLVAQSGATAGNQVMQAGTFVFPRATNNLVFRWANFVPTSSAALYNLDAGPSDYTVKAALRYNSVTYPIVFPQGRTQTVAAGATVDSLPLALALPAGATPELRWLISYATAPANWPLSTKYNDDKWNVFGTGITDDVDTTTTLFVRQTNYFVLPPFHILGDTANRNAIEIMGDSISSDGANDGFVHNSGYMQRGIVAAGIPFTNNGAPSNALSIQVGGLGATAGQIARRLLTRSNSAVTHVFCGLCTNDFANGKTDTAILGYLSTLKGQLDPLGIRLIPITCTPRTDPTNTTKNSIDSATVFSTYRPNYNAAIRANNGVGYGYIDVASATEAGSTGLWRTDLGTPSSDGIHPSTALHAAIAPLVQAVAAGLS